MLVMLGIIYVKPRKIGLNSECHYAECHYAECRYAECRGATFEIHSFRPFS
jgi:hypothetical protein